MTGRELGELLAKHGVAFCAERGEGLNAVAAELDRIKEFQIDVERKSALLEGLTLAMGEIEHDYSVRAIESLIAEKRKGV